MAENAIQTYLKTLGKSDHIPITTLEKFQDSYTSSLIKAMYESVLKRLEKIAIEALIIPDLPDYSDKVDDLQEKFEDSFSDLI
ncbi:MAG: hypothetical protein ACFFAU_21465 [Candidatus Hodarchaeota archaeon]